MENIDFFENTSIRLIDNEVYGTVQQITELYESPERTVYENIAKLKEDGLIVGAEIRNNVNNRRLQLFNLDEIIAIGFRLRSERAILFQKWAISKLKNEILKAHEEIKQAQIMESIAWNYLDAKENHRR
jgi:hypothetical protein